MSDWIPVERIRCRPRRRQYCFGEGSRVKPAFTLLELIISLAIIGLMLSLLSSAIQHARERARVVTCKSNLRQFALASISMSDGLRMLPESRIEVNSQDRLTRVISTWGSMVATRPQPSNNGQVDYSAPSDLCPSAIEKVELSAAIDFNRAVETSDYRGNMGMVGSEQAEGPFAILRSTGRRRSVSEIEDGLSRTFYAWESIGSRYVTDETCHGSPKFDVRWLEAGQGADSLFVYPNGDLHRGVSSAANGNFLGLNRGVTGVVSGYNFVDAFLVRSNTQGSRLCYLNYSSDSGSPISLHPSSTQFAMCDGSVHEFSRMTSFNVIHALTSINDGSDVTIEDD